MKLNPKVMIENRIMTTIIIAITAFKMLEGSSSGIVVRGEYSGSDGF